MKQSESWLRPHVAALVLVAAISVSLALTRTAYADDPLGEKELQVERQLGCPICTNLPLNVCDNQLCQEMRGIIHQKLSQGETPEQVVAYFVSRYGDSVLLEPPRRGFSLAAWYLPFAALALGAVVFAGFLRQSLRRGKMVEQRLQFEDPGLERYRQQVRHDLEKLEENQ